MSIRVPPAVMELLIALDKSHSEGHEWTSAVGRTFDFDVRFWAISRTLVETNTIDGEAPVFRITEDGMRAMTHGELQDRPPAAPPPPPVKLKSSTEYLLTKLAEALDDGDGWVFSKAIDINTVPYHMRQAAFNKGYIERRGTTSKTEFRITPVGLSVIGIAAATGAPTSVETARTSRLSDADKQRMIDESRQRVQAKKSDSSTHQLDALKEGRITIDELDATLRKLPKTFEERIPASEVGTPAPAEVDRRFKDTHTDEDLQKIGEVLKSQPHPFISPVVNTKITTEEVCASGCNDCLYRDIVELLEKRVPGVRDIVTGLKKTVSGQS